MIRGRSIRPRSAAAPTPPPVALDPDSGKVIVRYTVTYDPPYYVPAVDVTLTTEEREAELTFVSRVDTLRTWQFSADDPLPVLITFELDDDGTNTVSVEDYNVADPVVGWGFSVDQAELTVSPDVYNGLPTDSTYSPYPNVVLEIGFDADSYTVPLATDTFTAADGTALTSLPGWTAISTAANLIVNGNSIVAVRTSGLSGQAARRDEVPTAGWTRLVAQVTLTLRSSIQQMGPALWDSTAGGTRDGYSAQLDTGNQITLTKFNAGSGSTVGTPYTLPTTSAGTSYVIEISASSDPAPVITVKIDGTERITYVDGLSPRSVDRVGIRATVSGPVDASTSPKLDNFIGSAIYE